MGCGRVSGLLQELTLPARTGDALRCSLAYRAIFATVAANGARPMPTRNVVLTERQETLIEALVQSGRYHKISD
jgi:hypothetical protein